VLHQDIDPDHHDMGGFNSAGLKKTMILKNETNLGFSAVVLNLIYFERVALKESVEIQIEHESPEWHCMSRNYKD
jgi:hypothetical protein